MEGPFESEMSKLKREVRALEPLRKELGPARSSSVKAGAS
jgi:hypothetical protein